MNLPVVAASNFPDPAALWRLFTDLRMDHAAALGEETQVAFGRAVKAAPHSSVVVLPAETAPAGSIEAIAAELGSRVEWITPDSHPLSGEHFERKPQALYRLGRAAGSAQGSSAMMILPARAAALQFDSFWQRHPEEGAKQTALHLDDPQYEAFGVLHGGTMIATAALQTRGEIGLVCDVATDDEMGSKALAPLIQRVVELAARSQLRHVFTAAGENAQWPAAAGFVPVIRFSSWRWR